MKWIQLNIIFFKSARVLCEKFVQHRGIVYPKWSRKKNLIPVNMTEEFDQDYFRRYKWEIDKYVYSFSKHVENPTTISLKKSSEYNFHIQNCKYKRIKNLTEKFLVYPSMNTPASWFLNYEMSQMLFIFFTDYLFLDIVNYFKNIVSIDL